MRGVRFMTLLGVEFRKIKRSRLLLLFFAASVILWIPSVLNAELNFTMQAEGISPENSFFIQGFMGMAWFMYPAGMVVGTVLISQTERTNRGMLKMLSLPVGRAWLCLAKFVVLVVLSAAQVLMMTGMYYISAAAAGRLQGYSFLLPPLFVAGEAGLLFCASLPMLAVFWMLSVAVRTPIFSVGLGLASIVPSVFAINTKVWFAYPMCYPFFVITAEYGKLAENLDTAQVDLVPWIPVAVVITGVCLLVACLCFGQGERRE